MSTITTMPTPMQAIVYDDEGCCHPSAMAIYEQLERMLDSSIVIKKVDSVYLNKKNWGKHTVLLAMGGGACSEFEKRLGKKGMDNIREYVGSGGSILALCAASYFISASSYFKLLNQSAIEKERSLALFPGKAIGPLIDTENHLSPSAARAMEVAIKIDETIKKGYLYYQGGCYFTIPKGSQAKILATYKELPVAISCSYGAGTDNVYLTGLHPEFRWPKSLQKVRHPVIADLAKILSEQEIFRDEVWDGIGRTLKLPLKKKQPA